ncbi:DNA excision repair protein [Apiospora kogelbergensis]|uniref:DNA excision repair protein n=1 Tax=Apiospora kogelbergensis TaxID=1337665 RepID=A0AAW0RCB3_9PEZI
MGVNGLWTVVQPCARPTNLATLNRKRLAVDASIWIYQFLKAVRDKEGNALRNSHVVGFFRRICKLLWFGVKPVFVFDGGAPALKRQTITSRKRRREGRREDAVRTAGKLLAVQMQRIAEEEGDKRKRQLELEKQGAAPAPVEEPVEELPAADQLVYVDEIGMSQQERQQSRKFFKQDAYHLPELPTNIEGMGKPEDPRIMSVEELEEYARQFQSGEDINLYDFSKIDFEGEFFMSLPPADRYNILNAARLRSRLRMGLSKEQLEEMFPDRMAFSRFQIERVQERNHLTQRLMKEAGMTGTDLTLNGSARIAGESDREYILVKNDGAEGGWALGVVSREKDLGEIHKPIDVDELQFHYQAKTEEDEWEDEDDFEDVPIEGLNRLPKVSDQVKRLAEQRQQFLESMQHHDRNNDSIPGDDEDDSLFVQDPNAAVNSLFESGPRDELEGDEEEDLSRAIAMSLQNQHKTASSPVQEEDEAEFEDVPVPDWTQKAVEPARPVTAASGSVIAHIVNNRANAAIPKRRRSDASDDSDVDLGAAMAAARKKKKTTVAPQPRPVVPSFSNIKNPFNGPLPFEKLDWKSSIFGKKPEAKRISPTESVHAGKETTTHNLAGGFEKTAEDEDREEEDLSGGFTRDEEELDAPRPLPPWMTQEVSDIREAVKGQQERLREVNEEDREAAFEAEKCRRKDAIIEIQSDDDDSDVEIVDAPSTQPKTASKALEPAQLSPASLAKVSPPQPRADAMQDDSIPAIPSESVETSAVENITEVSIRNSLKSPSPEPEFEDVEVAPAQPIHEEKAMTDDSPEPEFEDIAVTELANDVIVSPMEHAEESTFEPEVVTSNVREMDGELFVNDDEDGTAEDDFSDPEDEELFAQLAEEAEEHAKFASQLNNKSEQENQEAYERELKALRTQQKKDRRDADEVTQIMITECQALLRLFGIPYITAPMEAEAQCAELVQLGLVDGIVTDDSDTFLFGGTRVYKNMFNGNKFVECYLANDLEKELSLSREQLISLAHLLGSDYTEGLPGVGPVTAVEILSEFPGREGLAEFREWWQDVQVQNRPKEADAGSKFRKKFRKAQGTKLFLPMGFPNPAVFEAYLKPEVDDTPDPFQWGVPDVDGLRRFLMATIGWSQERTDEVLVPVIRDMNRREAEGTQSNITRYFEGGVGTGVKEAFAPRERVQTSKRMAEAVNKLRANAVVDGLSAEAPVEAAPAPSLSGRGRRAKKAAAAVIQDGEEDHVDNVEDGEEEDDATETRRPRRRGRKVKGSA